jgi:malate dehydrogenase
MSVIAVLGAGELGGAVALALASGGRFREVRIVDANAAVAAGKALDIQQSGPIDRFDTRLSGTDDVLAAAGVGVIVLADAAGGGEWEGERALAMISQLVRTGTNAPFVFAGAGQHPLMETVARELGVSGDRLVGTAASAMVTAARALVGIEVGGSGVDVQVTVAGKPRSLVAAWSSATIGGSLVTDRVAAHRLLAISKALADLWPPGPRAIGAATAPIVEGLAFGSRRVHQALVILDGAFDAPGSAAMLPIELGQGRVLRRLMPSLSPQEQTGSGLFSTGS